MAGLVQSAAAGPELPFRVGGAARGWPLRYAELFFGSTENLSVRRAALADIGGFDDYADMPAISLDADLGGRLYDAGYTTVSEPGAVARQHHTEPGGLWGELAALAADGRACVYSCERRPDESKKRRNTVAAIGAAAAVAVLFPHLRRWSAGAIAAGVACEVLAMPGARMSGRVLALAYQAGIVSEALRRGRPWLAFGGFDYANPDRFIVRGERAPDAGHAPDSERTC